MKKYRLKGEAFEVVDGPFAGKKFQRGVAYEESQVPPMEKKRFVEVPAAQAPAEHVPAKKSASTSKQDTAAPAAEEGKQK